jgi:hypothetical protein
MFRCIDNYNSNGVLISLRRLVPEYKKDREEPVAANDEKAAVNLKVLTSSYLS